jgi:hypothetical protein
MSKRAVVLSVVAASTLLGGCYSYVPSTLDAVEPGHAVRIRLTAAETERLAELRLSDERNMEGVVVRRTGDELLVETHVGRLDARAGTRPLTQRINVPIAEIQDVEFRRRDNLKTGAAIGALSVAVGVGIAAALSSGEGSVVEPPDPVPEFRRRPFELRFRIGF